MNSSDFFRPMGIAMLTVVLLDQSVFAQADSLVKLTSAQRANAQIELLTLDRVTTTVASGLTVTGRVEPGSGGRTVISSPAAGRIIELTAFPGTRLRRDAAILTLAGPDIATLHRTLRESRAAATVAQKRVVRDRALLKEGVIAPSRVEQSEAAASAASAHLRQASNVLPGLTLGARDSEVVVRTPREGILTGPGHSVGERVELGDTLAVIGTPTRLRVALAASANVARSIRAGDKASIRSRGCESNAVVESVGVGVELNQTVPLNARITDDNSCLLAGESVTASIAPRLAAEGAWALPARAFVRRGSETFVFVERANGFEPVQVDALAAIAGFARATVLRQGDRVAISGSALLKGAWIGIAEDE
jgi:biotin carboxyl carrier protein